MADENSAGGNSEVYKKVRAKLGAGTFGTVLKCYNSVVRKNQAVKKIEIQPYDREVIDEEVKAMKVSESDHIVPVIDAFYEENELVYYIVMPYYKNGNLQRLMEARSKWEPIQIICLLYQICEAFLCIGKKEVIHMDLKPDNILLKREGEYLVCDFGCAKEQENMNKSFIFTLSTRNGKGIGTTRYAAPEVIVKGGASKYTDIWSLGIILYEMLYNKHPIICHNIASKHYTNYQYMDRFLNKKIKIEFPPLQPEYEGLSIICKSMLQPQKRMNWQELKRQIYDQLKLRQNTPIVTSIEFFIRYFEDVTRIMMGLNYYLNKNATHLQKFKLEKLIQDITRETKLYIYVFSQQIEQQIVQQSGSFRSLVADKQLSFYIFPEIKRSIKNLESKILVHLLNKNFLYTKEEYERTDSCERQLSKIKLRLLSLIEQLAHSIKKVGEKAGKIEKLFSWEKIENICSFVLGIKAEGLLDYSSRHKIHEFSLALVNE